MCCEDVKIDLSKRSELLIVALTNADQSLIAADPHRFSLILCPPTSGDAWVICDAPAVLGNGIHLTASQLPLVISREYWGNMASKAWRVIHSAGGVNMAVGIVELIPHVACPQEYQHG